MLEMELIRITQTFFISILSSPVPVFNSVCFLHPLCSLNYSGMCLASDTQFSDFLDGMGPAQFVGRQTLATTSMGEQGSIQTHNRLTSKHNGMFLRCLYLLLQSVFTVCEVISLSEFDTFNFLVLDNKIPEQFVIFYHFCLFKY